MPAVNTPTAVVTALRRRANLVAPDVFEADLRLLSFLAKQWQSAVAPGSEQRGVVRDVMREFGLNFRATSAAVRVAEEAALNRLVEVDWRAEMDAAVEAQRRADEERGGFG